MSEGYVYALTNSAMPGLIKIGKTTRDPHDRAREISSGTGVPAPFEVHCAVFCPNCHAAEREAHRVLADLRLNDDREFFRCEMHETEHVEKLLGDIQREQVEGWLEAFIPDQIIVPETDFFDVALLADAAAAYDMHTYALKDALAYLTPEDMKGAVERYQAHVEARKAARESGEEMPPLRLVR
ncbi:GIY-YIG nuclease family protein [Dinoroseobacter sp. S375]|uniref:GIY-YIG nuclease family protein n=1 Tax=Dinoroseobacter sp. S375 TaxID=3415136 RepID=UPI003C7B861F